MRLRFTLLPAALLAASVSDARAQQPAPPHFTHADTLRGTNGPARAWWDAAFYDLHVAVRPADSSISGWNTITYRVLSPAREMQIDLKTPLDADSVVQDGAKLALRRDGDAYFATMASPQVAGTTRRLSVYYHGKPHVAVHAPWDGGIVWATDSLGNPHVATAVQGFGASAWWPVKDIQSDEPDSQRVAITVPSTLQEVSNGRLRSTKQNADGTTTYEWFVTNPINNYGVALNIAKYAHITSSYTGERGALSLDYWPLAYHEDAAKRQFAQVPAMLSCFEHWFGPYPWYEDGYKLVESPHLGMEHQSAVAYGNHYLNGYLGRDLSGTGWGLKWDFIVVHESAHEWWGNNITSNDIADMWVHESFANYAENLFTECQDGKAAGSAYVIGTRRAIRNDRPIIGAFGVQDEGSGDMYYKGGNMLHIIRQLVNDDEKWRGILRGLNTEFRHRTVSGQQVRDYITQKTGLPLGPVFAEYLETTMVPVFEYRMKGDTLEYRWADVVPNFAMPVKVAIGATTTMLTPTSEWQSRPSSSGDVKVDENFYVLEKNVR